MGTALRAFAHPTLATLADGMRHPEETSVMEPFPDKTGTGWHVII